MFWKTILFLSLSYVSFAVQSPQLKLPGERGSDALPQELTENETQAILKERGSKKHVDATLKISNARLLSAAQFAGQSQFEAAVADVNMYASLIVYADAYTRKLPEAQNKDRNQCLKKIEQAIFKQARPLEGLLSELPYDSREQVAPRLAQVKKIRLRALNDLLGNGEQMIKSGAD